MAAIRRAVRVWKILDTRSDESEVQVLLRVEERMGNEWKVRRIVRWLNVARMDAIVKRQVEHGYKPPSMRVRALGCKVAKGNPADPSNVYICVFWKGFGEPTFEPWNDVKQWTCT